MKARDIISPLRSLVTTHADRSISADMPITEVLPRLLDSPDRMLGVEADGSLVGVIDESSLLEGLGRFIAPRDDTSFIVVECPVIDYSASAIAHAVEDADAHLVDLWTTPAPEGRVRVTLRVRLSDPTTAVHSLERYGFDVVSTYSALNTDLIVAGERLSALRSYLNV